MQQLLAISFLTGVEQIKWSRYNLKYHKTPEKTIHQCRVDITIMQQKWKSVLTNLFLCSDVFTYATVILDCPALSKDRTMRRKVSENSMQGSVSVKKKTSLKWLWVHSEQDHVVIEDGLTNIKVTNESLPLVNSFRHHDLHHLGSLIQIQSLSPEPVLFSQQSQTKEITGSGNEIDQDFGHLEGRHPYLLVGLCHARKQTLDYCTYLPGKTLPKESQDPADNLYPCYSWHHCILHMKVSVETTPQLWRKRNKNH